MARRHDKPRLNRVQFTCQTCKRLYSPRTWKQRYCSKKCIASDKRVKRRKDQELRFWKKVDRSAGWDACWPWLGSRNQAGYGRFKTWRCESKPWSAVCKSEPATRIAWEYATGESVPLGMLLCHHCDNPPCCNPLHLFVGTHKDNTQDAIRKRRPKQRISYVTLHRRRLAEKSGQNVATIEKAEVEAAVATYSSNGT